MPPQQFPGREHNTTQHDSAGRSTGKSRKAGEGGLLVTKTARITVVAGQISAAQDLDKNPRGLSSGGHLDMS